MEKHLRKSEIEYINGDIVLTLFERHGPGEILLPMEKLKGLIEWYTKMLQEKPPKKVEEV